MRILIFLKLILVLQQCREYTTEENGDLIAKKKSYTEAVGKSQLEDFGKALEQSENGEIKDGDFKTGLTLLGL